MKTQTVVWGEWRMRIVFKMAESVDFVIILVPRAHDPFGLRQGSRPLAGTEAGSPRITDFRLLCAASEI